MTDQTIMHMSAAEFLQRPPSSQRIELIDGRVVTYGDDTDPTNEGDTMPAPSLLHQRVVVKLIILLSGLIPDGDLYTAPTDLMLNDQHVYQPDVMWVAADNTRCAAIDDKYLRGAPDLVIEVLSPTTYKQDRGIKFRTYQREGVREYWLVDPALRLVEVWRLQDGRFDQHGIFEHDETFTSGPLGRDVLLATVFA